MSSKNNALKKKEHYFSYLYWSLPFLLLIPQVIFLLNSLNQIRYEELAESVRNVFWLQHRFVYDGVSSNIGWYGILLMIYKLFGFSLNTAKIFRLVLQFFSLLALVKLIRIFFRKRYGWLPVLVIGLSPTILYFNTLQTSYGVDLQMIPVCLLLLLTLDFSKKIHVYIQQAVLWILVMITWMSYATFLFYLPILIGMYIWILRNQWQRKKSILTTSIAISIIAFVFPLIVGILYVRNNELLFYDPMTRSGLFRGAGQIATTQTYFTKNFFSIVQDFFISGRSYNFELAKSDFSDSYPLLTIEFVVGLSIFLLIKKKAFRLPFVFIWGMLFGTFLIASMTADPTFLFGMRRNTSLLAGIYGIFTVSWYYVSRAKWQTRSIKFLVIAGFLLLLFHHIIVFPINVAHLSDQSIFAYSVGNFPGKSWKESMKIAVVQLQKKNLLLPCGQRSLCRYQEIYATLEGTCEWNHLSCNSVYGFDPKSGKYLKLSPELWRAYYWQH